jgi:hypothetical protein
MAPEIRQYHAVPPRKELGVIEPHPVIDGEPVEHDYRRSVLVRLLGTEVPVVQLEVVNPGVWHTGT